MYRLSLDDIYKMIAYNYGEQNSQRSATSTFAHFVEVCGILTVHDRKKKKESVTVQDALCKALGWYFPLMAKFKVRSVQELIFRKFPYACPYCRRKPHEDGVCKLVRGTSKTVSHHELRHKYEENLSKMPSTLDEWQKMFQEIYPRSLKDQTSTIGLLEEIGELAEAIRVFDRYPKYFCGEAADVFSYLMGIANELSLRIEQDEDKPFSLQTEFLSRYPGLCTQCGYQVCKCPPIPEATVGRMAKELELPAEDGLLKIDLISFESDGKAVAERMLSQVGGYKGLLARYPFDRGAVNSALVALCLKLADDFEDQPQLAKTLRAAAVTAVEAATPAGTRQRSTSIQQVVSTLREAMARLGEESEASLSLNGPLSEQLGLSLKAVRVLLVLANPEGTGHIRLHEEERVIKEAIKLSKHRDNIIIETLPAATVDDLRRALLDAKYDIVHFSGHGDSTGPLFDGQPGDTSVRTLIEELAKDEIKCLVLNACSILNAPIQIKPKFVVVGMEARVGDQAAIEFSRGFYDAIGAGKSIDKAIDEGNKCTRLKGLEAQLPLKVLSPN